MPVYSGDSEPSARVAALAAGADLLVHECSFPEPFEVMNHTTPRRLGILLKNVSVKRVVLTHLYPQALGYRRRRDGYDDDDPLTHYFDLNIFILQTLNRFCLQRTCCREDNRTHHNLTIRRAK